jgi:PKD repeat protein
MLLLLTTILLTFSSRFVRCQIGLELTVKTDEASYIQREHIQISGNMTYNGQPVNQGHVQIEIKDPLKIILLRTLSFNANFPNFYIEIESLYPCDQTANPIEFIEIGKTSSVYVFLKIRNKGVFDREVYATVTLIDGRGVPLESSWNKVLIKAGLTATYIPMFNIPKWVSLGNITIYANVYSDLPENNGYALCPEKEVKLGVIESEFSENPVINPPQSTAENGTYKLCFESSPESIPGNYVVYVTGWFNGELKKVSTNFQLNVVPLPPLARFKIWPPYAAPNYTISFDATISSAEGYNDSIISYYWNFGDGKTASGSRVTHSYSKLGNYSVTLQVRDSEGLTNTTSRIISIIILHDVVCFKISCSERIYTDWLAPSDVTIKNRGTAPETFSIKAYFLNDTHRVEASAQIITINPFEKKTYSLNLNTSKLGLLCNYTLEVLLDLASDANPSDNILHYGPIITWLLGDQNYNRIIDICDVSFIAGIYGAYEGDPNWRPLADIVRDGKITILDVSKICGMYGRKF